MVTVVNNTITLVRGDTVEIPVTIRLRNGEEYVPSEGDVIRFALKESYGDNVPVLIRKELPRWIRKVRRSPSISARHLTLSTLLLIR